MPRTAALPMYPGHPAQEETLWRVLAARLVDAGMQAVPPTLTWPADYHAQWALPQLLISQACGYPLVTQLQGQVRVVGGFHYRVPGCTGVLNRSQLVVRAGDPASRLADLRGRRVAYNSTSSQSGYNSLRALVAPLSTHGRFFGSHLETGGHLASVHAVRDSLADIASIDCVSLAGFRKHTPDATRGLRILAESAPYPGLPLITAASTSDADLAMLRGVIGQTVRDPALAEVCEALFIAGFEPLEYADYQVCTDMHNAARALGYPAL